MARISGVQLPKNKRIVVALTYIHGVGLTTSQDVLQKAKVDEAVRVKDLTEKQVNDIRSAIDNLEQKVEGDLRREVLLNKKRLREIGSRRGDRLSKNLPVRGQRTKSNSRTVRGNKRMTTTSGKSTAPSKT